MFAEDLGWSHRLNAWLRRLLHSFAYFLASLVALGLFFLVLLLTESFWYALTSQAVSAWAMVLAALVAVPLFSPVVNALQRWIDEMFYRQYLDTLEAIRALGAGDLAQMPPENIESALLSRIAMICRRERVALDERDTEDGGLYCFPEDAPLPRKHGEKQNAYELSIPIEHRKGTAWLHLGRRRDGWLADPREINSLGSVARFAVMSLEHARLSHSQAQDARLDSISRVTAQLHSHDLKNRLHDLAFLAHHIQSGKLDEDDLRRMVDAIRKVVERMQTLMQRMADPNAPIHPRLKPVDLIQMIRKMIDGRLWPEGISVEITQQTVPAVAADMSMLNGVIENLFDNAVQAMNKQGKIRVEIDDQQGDIEVRVIDSGSGMTAAFVEHRLFRLFATSKESGLGIGLYLSKRIIEAHGGSIQGSSAGEGKGSTFIVRLPAWHAQQSLKEKESV